MTIINCNDKRNKDNENNVIIMIKGIDNDHTKNNHNINDNTILNGNDNDDNCDVDNNLLI